MLTSILTKENLRQSFQSIQKDWDEPHRINKVYFKDLTARDILTNYKSISNSVYNEIQKETFYYQPISPKQAVIGKKQRTIYVPYLIDFAVQRILSQAISKHIDKIYSNSLYSYRKGKSNYQAIQKLAEYINDNKQQNYFVYQTDIRNYTDSIYTHENSPLWDILKTSLKEANINITTPYEEQLLIGSIAPTIVEGEKTHRINYVPTGLPMTGIIANLYLNKLDHQIAQNKDIVYIRYGDDITVISKDISTLLKQQEMIQTTAKQLNLEIHPAKERLTQLNLAGRSIDPRFTGCSRINMLGFSIYADGSISLKTGKIKEIVRKVRQCIHSTNYLMRDSSKELRLQTICDAINTLCSKQNYWLPDTDISWKLSQITQQGMRKHIDYVIAFEIAKCITGLKSVKSFRYMPYRTLREKYGLKSLAARTLK